MRKDDLIDSLGRIDDDLIQGVEALRSTRKSSGWKKWAGLAACFCLILAAVAAMPRMLPGTISPPEQSDVPVQTGPFAVIGITQTGEEDPVWTAIYNNAESVLAMDRAYIRGIFTEALNESQLATLLPEGWGERMDCTGYGVFDSNGNLLEVLLTAHTPTPVTISLTSGVFDICYFLDGEAEVSVCGDTEYRLYAYANAGSVHLGAETVIGGVFLHFTMDAAPEELEQAKLEFQTVLESFAFCPDGKPDLSAIVPDKIPELTEKIFETLSDARTERDFGRYLPTELPGGFAESAIRRFRFDESNYLSALWSRGLDDLSWVITPYTEADEGRLTSVDELQNYDLSRYPIPREDSVPEELREIVDDPIFDAQELTLEAVYRRAYKVQDVGDTNGWRMRFSVRYGDVIVSISSKGVEPEWLYGQLNCLNSE